MNISRSFSLALVAVSPLVSLSGSAQSAVDADPIKSRFTVDVANPEAHLPSDEEIAKHPLDWGYLLMELDERAVAAIKRADWNAALKFHRAAAKLTPDRAISFALVCKDYEMLGKRGEALATCAKALSLPGAKLDYYVRFVHLVKNRPGGVDNQEVQDALAAIDHLKSAPGTQLAGYELQCELSLQTRNQTALEQCSKELRKSSPNAPRPVTFAWALALQRGDFTLARKLIKDAKHNGLDKAVLQKMERTTTAVEKGEPLEFDHESDAGVKATTASTSGADDDDSKPNNTRREPGVEAQDEQSSVTQSVRADLSQGIHPMLKWLVGLLAAVVIAFPLARRFVRSGV